MCVRVSCYVTELRLYSLQAVERKYRNTLPFEDEGRQSCQSKGQLIREAERHVSHQVQGVLAATGGAQERDS